MAGVSDLRLGSFCRHLPFLGPDRRRKGLGGEPNDGAAKLGDRAAGGRERDVPELERGRVGAFEAAQRRHRRPLRRLSPISCPNII